MFAVRKQVIFTLYSFEPRSCTVNVLRPRQQVGAMYLCTNHIELEVSSLAVRQGAAVGVATVAICRGATTLLTHPKPFRGYKPINGLYLQVRCGTGARRSSAGSAPVPTLATRSTTALSHRYLSSGPHKHFLTSLSRPFPILSQCTLLLELVLKRCWLSYNVCSSFSIVP